MFCFKRLGAKALFISGTHRCNHSSYSSCSGTTTACSASATPYRVSDPAHNELSIFQKTTEVLFSERDNTVFVQLHGFAKQEDDPYVIMSNGSRSTPNPDYITILRDELYDIDNSLTFKIAHIDLNWSRLIAFTNVQGRFINGSVSPCSVAATDCSVRFIHIEQEKSKLRQDFIGWLKMYEALMNTFPETTTSIRKMVVVSKGAVLIYPNPSEGVITIKTTGPSGITIYNSLGRCIYQGYYDRDQVELDLSRHAPGIYLVRVKNGTGISTQRFILKN